MGYIAKKGAARLQATRPARSATTRGKRVMSSEERPHQHEVMTRLRRVEGQIRGILQMMEKEESCDAIAQQLSAARKALDRAFYEMMACSLEMEVSHSAQDATLCERIAEKTRMMAKYA